MPITSHDLYTVLAPVASGQSLMTYGGLSQAYLRLTGQAYPPHLSWDQPLGDLNKQLDARGWPPLSAVVVLQDSAGGFGEPGGGFWESCPSIPRAPTSPTQRTSLWLDFLRKVYAAPWPATIPTTPPPRKGS